MEMEMQTETEIEIESEKCDSRMKQGGCGIEKAQTTMWKYINLHSHYILSNEEKEGNLKETKLHSSHTPIVYAACIRPIHRLVSPRLASPRLMDTS
ncbi:uncharacterized protein EAE98_010295 [Botrytis deweyae]|uniref:Uncharacterized protein n=1 Tax=Botrytis deweyae TaxID=2478750 RepID=A0ABQ7I914_9HELO|nr:uncharacterized protein EAE98_010295 [Botrytis deweyae]KAF7917190.1 hypothetical protein EAE98_010295 [Botrytis deweyae]